MSPNDLVPSLGRRPRSPLASDWMLSCFQLSHFLSRPVSQSIRPSLSFVWSSTASTRFPPQAVLSSVPFHIARGRFLDQFRSCVLHHRSGPSQVLPLHSYGSYFHSCNLTFRPLLDLFSPFPTYPVRSGHPLVHSFYYHRVSPVLSLSVTQASGILVLKHVVV